MPIAATPFEQEVLPEATKFTLEPTVAPLDGLLTVTPAKAVAQKKKPRIAVESCTSLFISRFLRLDLLAGLRGLGLAMGSADSGENSQVEPYRWDARIDVLGVAELTERSAHSIQASPESQRENAVLKNSCNAGRTNTAMSVGVPVLWIPL